MAGPSIQATPFFPGRASGPISRNRQGANQDAILLVNQAEVWTIASTTAAGLVVVDPAPFSHAMIKLLQLGIPTVLVTHQQAQALVEGTRVSMDGDTGRIWDPGEMSSPLAGPSIPAPGVPVTTRDGEAIELRASVADAAGAEHAVRHGAASVGLVRSEFLVPEGDREPDAGFYASALSELCQAAQPLPVTVRLLDLAADKHPPWLILRASAELSGTLGLHGGRMYTLEAVRRVVDAQLEAIGQLAPRYPLSLIVPALDRIEDFLAWRRRIESTFGLRLAVGAMIETPTTALDIKRWLEVADFAAVGCNDLMQCLFGANRDLAPVGAVADPYAPALFRFLGQVAEAAGDVLAQVQLCGLLAQMPGILSLLVGLGYRSFSVDPLLVPHLAHSLAHVTVAHAEEMAHQAQSAGESDEVRVLLGLSRTSIWTPVAR